MDMLNINRFYQIRLLMDSFPTKTLQAVAVALVWAKNCGITLTELEEFTKLLPTVAELERYGYFRRYHTVEQLKLFRELEKRLPKEKRIALRHARLAHSFSGAFAESQGGG